MKHIIRISILTGLVILSCRGCAYAQENHIGGFANLQWEGQGSGNGSIYGVEVQHSHNFGKITLVTNGQFTLDRKNYLDRSGKAVRVGTRARYALPMLPRVFAQGGGYVGYFTIGGVGGYSKRVLQPVAGGGVHLGNTKNFTANANYLWLFRSNIYGKGATSPWVLDGYTSGQRGGAEFAFPFKGRWFVLFNTIHGRFIYQRSVVSYGADLAAVKHRYSVTEISVGIGHRYGK